MLKTMLNGLVLYGLRRLKEPSTWSGLTLGLTALGMHISPELSGTIQNAGIGIAGLITFCLPDSFTS